MRLDQLPRSENVEDRRGQGGGFRVPGGRGGLGIGTVVVLGLLAWALGIDPRLLIDGAEIFSGGDSSQQQSGEQGEAKHGTAPGRGWLPPVSSPRRRAP